MSKVKKLEYSDFNIYPHYVYATAFLVKGELADYKIGSYESNWERRTFRGSSWENEVAEHFNDWDLTCKYKKILVNNSDEHNDAFELLEMWLDNSFKKYKKVGFVFMYEKAEDKIIEDQTIDIDSIEEIKIEGNIADTRVLKINELIQAVKHLNKEIQSIKK